jgi:hypothetical protein
MIDAVLTHPHHPTLCGVVKFSTQLAERLGVPCHRHLGAAADHPLYSVKGSEGDLSWIPRPPRSYDVFAHDAYGFVPVLAQSARTVYAANRVIAAALRATRPDVISAWCPSTIQGNPTRGVYRVLTFGMAHKLQADRYLDLKATLDADYGEDYTVEVSTAVHEGSPWDATAQVADQLRAIFGPRLRVLGYLSDDALARELAECDAVALFFEGGVRENNTTALAAFASGKRVFTNYDAASPRSLHGYTWDRLIEVLRAA